MCDSEKVLLLGLMPQDIAFISRLLSSFDTDICIADMAQIENNALFSEEADICLVIFRIGDIPQPIRILRHIRQMLKYPVPVLLLVPWDMTFEITDYLRAGADDYWVLPIDESAFAIQFYVMLEWGHAIVRSGTEMPHPNTSELSLWQRISEKLHKGLEYFSPKSLLLSINRNTPIFQKWNKVKALGFGHCGEIWMLKSPDRNEFAVAKIPYSTRLNIRFLRAAAILKRMESHANSVHLIEVVEEERKVILIEEFVPGLTLQQCLDKGMDSASREKAFLQLLDVMSYAHRMKIIHLDIKPDNMMITPSGNLKLLDFGVARDLSHYSLKDPGYGSRQYMAPEQFTGKSGVISDVWALGVLLYVLCTGCFPFYDDPLVNYFETISQTPPVPPHNIVPDIPKNLETIILNCLKTDMNERYPHADELRVDLLLSFPEFGKGKIFPDRKEKS